MTCGNFEGRVELVWSGVDVFVGLVEQGHSGDMKRGLEWISEAQSATNQTWSFMSNFLKANMVSPRLTFFSCFFFGSKVCDWILLCCVLYFSLRGFVLWAACDAQSPCTENNFFLVLTCSVNQKKI